LYAFAAVAVFANAAEMVSFGYGVSGPQGIVGGRHKKSVVSASTIITDHG
jgi:hypothetical protein